MKKLFHRRNFLKAAGVSLLPLAGLPGQEPSDESLDAEAGPAHQAEAAPKVKIAPSEILISQMGPLPISMDFTTGSDEPATLFISGSVWTQKASTLIGIEVLFEGNQVGMAQIFSNGPNTHRSVIPIHIPIFLDKRWPRRDQPPTYTVELRAMNADTQSDPNDFYQVVLHL